MTVCVHRGEGWLVHVRVCAHGTREIGEGGFRTCAYIHGRWVIELESGCMCMGWVETVKEKEVVHGGKSEGLCKLNYLVNW